VFTFASPVHAGTRQTQEFFSRRHTRLWWRQADVGRRVLRKWRHTARKEARFSPEKAPATQGRHPYWHHQSTIQRRANQTQRSSATYCQNQATRRAARCRCRQEHKRTGQARNTSHKQQICSKDAVWFGAHSSVPYLWTKIPDWRTHAIARPHRRLRWLNFRNCLPGSFRCKVGKDETCWLPTRHCKTFCHWRAEWWVEQGDGHGYPTQGSIPKSEVYISHFIEVLTRCFFVF